MITAGLSEKLERIQRQALKIIYGWEEDVGRIMEVKNLEALEKRREKNILNFALKNEEKERFGKRWFSTSVVTHREVREGTRSKYRMPVCRTERMKNNPVTYMTKMLNEHYSN